MFAERLQSAPTISKCHLDICCRLPCAQASTCDRLGHGGADTKAPQGSSSCPSRAGRSTRIYLMTTRSFFWFLKMPLQELLAFARSHLLVGKEVHRSVARRVICPLLQ